MLLSLHSDALQAQPSWLLSSQWEGAGVVQMSSDSSFKLVRTYVYHLNSRARRDSPKPLFSQVQWSCCSHSPVVSFLSTQ